MEKFTKNDNTRHSTRVKRKTSGIQDIPPNTIRKAIYELRVWYCIRTVLNFY